MPKDPYWKEVYDKAQAQLRDLRDSRDEQLADLEETNQEIIQLEALIQHVAPFVSDSASVVVIAEGVAEMRLAEACREVLKQSDQFRTPRGVRDSLEASGYDLKQHNNALASIHGVLKRLAQTPDVEEVETGGKTRYRWAQKRYRVTPRGPSHPAYGGTMTEPPPITGFSGVPKKLKFPSPEKKKD